MPSHHTTLGAISLEHKRNVMILLLMRSGTFRLRYMGHLVVVVVVVVVFTLKAVPVSTQYFLTSVLVQLTRTPSVVTG